MKIRRPDWIEVEFEDENGEKHIDTFEGLMVEFSSMRWIT